MRTTLTVLLAIALTIAIGVSGASAQLDLHVWPVSELSPPKCKKVEASFLCSLSQLGLTYLLAVSL